MKVYVLMDHICEADILVGVFSTNALAKKYLKLQQKLDPFRFEEPEIIEQVVDDLPLS